MLSFTPLSPIASFTAAAAAPTAVAVASTSGVRATHVCLTNTDSANDVVVGWGETDTTAKLNAVSGNSKKQFYLVHGSQIVIAVSDNMLFTGIQASSTAVVKVQSGIASY